MGRKANTIISTRRERSNCKIFNDQVLTRDSAPISIRAALDGQGHNDCELVCRQQFPKVNELFRLLDGMKETFGKRWNGVCDNNPTHTRRNSRQT